MHERGTAWRGRWMLLFPALVALALFGPASLAAGPAARAEAGASAWGAVQAQLEAKVRAAFPAATEVTITSPEAAQRLVPACAAPLQVDPQGPRLFGNLSVRVTCDRPDRATAGTNLSGRTTAARLPVAIRVAVPMVVARTAIPRGAVLDAGMLALQPTAIGTLSDYLEDMGAVLGQRMRSGVRPGQALTMQQVEMGPLVTAGEQVSLVAGNGELSVSAPATALQSGRAGEQIRVRNVASGRVIPAWVVSRGTTRTRPPEAATAGPREAAAPIAKE